MVVVAKYCNKSGNLNLQFSLLRYLLILFCGLFCCCQARQLRNYKKKKHEKSKKRQELVDANIKNSKAKQIWLNAKGMETVQYHTLHEILAEEFSERTGSVRKLVHNHLLDPCKVHGMRADLTFPIDKFDQFYIWFDGLCELVKVLSSVWNETDPILIHGFVSRSDCEQKLQQSLPGTFIIRFSMTQAKSIAISYRSKYNVTHIKASLAGQNNFQFEIRSEHSLRYVCVCVWE